MVGMSIKVAGLKELERKLLTFEPKLGRKIIRQALRSGAKVIHSAVKADVPVETGALKESLKVRAMRKRKHSYGVMIATSEGWFKGDEFYGAFLEFGTSKMPARPFVRPAFDSEKDNAAKIIVNEIKQGIEQVAAEK
jgi:HK97 gp10 family phage protein